MELPARPGPGGEIRTVGHVRIDQEPIVVIGPCEIGKNPRVKSVTPVAKVVFGVGLTDPHATYRHRCWFEYGATLVDDRGRECRPLTLVDGKRPIALGGREIVIGGGGPVDGAGEFLTFEPPDPGFRSLTLTLSADHIRPGSSFRLVIPGDRIADERPKDRPASAPQPPDPPPAPVWHLGKWRRIEQTMSIVNPPKLPATFKTVEFARDTMLVDGSTHWSYSIEPRLPFDRLIIRTTAGDIISQSLIRDLGKDQLQIAIGPAFVLPRDVAIGSGNALAVFKFDRQD